MDSEEKLGILVAVVLLFGGGIWTWWTKRREKAQTNQQLYQQPMLQAGQTQDGQTARVNGVVVATQQLLTAPLSARPCVMFWTRIITMDNENKDYIQFVPFAINRGAEGIVQVDAQFARMDLPVVPTLNDRQKLEQFAQAMGLNIRDAATSQFYEIVLEPGMQVSIAGTVMTDGGAPQGYRGQGVQYRIAGNQQHPIVIGRYT